MQCDELEQSTVKSYVRKAGVPDIWAAVACDWLGTRKSAGARCSQLDWGSHGRVAFVGHGQLPEPS